MIIQFTMSHIKKHFDQLFRVIAVQHAALDTDIDTVEVDLELPRGYVAKIKIVIFEIISVGAPSLGTAVVGIDFQAALLRDPDDATTVQIPPNEVQHDVIADFAGSILHILDATNGLGVYFNTDGQKIIHFDENEFDIITARNCRFNATAGAQTAMDIKCTIYYTLEVITDTEVLELLDIL